MSQKWPLQTSSRPQHLTDTHRKLGMYQSESDSSESDDGFEAFPTTPDRTPNYSIKMADAPPNANHREGSTGANSNTAATSYPHPKLITLEGNIGVGKVSGVRPAVSDPPLPSLTPFLLLLPPFPLCTQARVKQGHTEQLRVLRVGKNRFFFRPGGWLLPVHFGRGATCVVLE